MRTTLAPKKVSELFNTSDFRNIRIIQPVTNTVTNTVEFDGNMNGESIINCKSIHNDVFTHTFTGSLYFSIMDHLQSTSILQVKIYEGEVVRIISYLTSKSGSNFSFSKITDTNEYHGSYVHLGSSGIISIQHPTELTVEFSCLSLA